MIPASEWSETVHALDRSATGTGMLAYTKQYIATGFSNTLLGNSYVNTVPHATIDEVVFSVEPTDAPIDWLDSDHVTYVSCDARPFRGNITRAVSCMFRANWN
jgi:hypothetical protein